MFESSTKVSKYSIKLLKIQTRLFPKKMKQIPNNMKIITEIYCKDTDISKEKMEIEATSIHMSENFTQEVNIIY